MKKSLLPLTFIFALLLMTWNTDSLFAQPVSVTVPDYAYGMVNSEYGTVTQAGVANPGAYGGYSVQENASPNGVAYAHGFRWWGYPSYPLLICGPLPRFNFPGNHGIWDNSLLPCMNPPTGAMGSWGGVIIEPENRKIWALTGAKKIGAPTAPYCIPNPYGPGQICYNLPSTWGRGTSYGFLRKVVVIKSTGTLQKGDPVNIKVKLTARGTSEGDGTVTCQGVLMMNRIGNPMEYMRWSDISDFFMAPMLAKFSIDMNEKDSASVTLAVGDTIRLEIGFNNKIEHPRVGGPVEADGWAGIEPHNLLVIPNYARTDSVKKIIKKFGNNLTYDLVCLTTGALLEPVTAYGPNLDEDKDGISDAQEKGQNGDNNLWDGDGDAIPDYKQANAASFHTFDGLNYVTLVVPSGTILSQLKVTANPSPSNTPADAEFPFGFFDFSIDGLEPGEAVNVTMILHNGTSITKYYKYGITPDNLTPHWYEFMFNGQTGAEINGNVITLHFVDGLRGDEDITANGSIKEPGGPAIAGATGISETTDKTGIIVYPNPSTGNVTLKLRGIMPEGNYLLNLYSNTGGIVQHKVINVCDVNEEFVIPTNNLPSGIYLISISGSNRVYKTRFIKLK